MTGRRFGPDFSSPVPWQVIWGLTLAFIRAAAAAEPIEVSVRGELAAPPKEPSVAGSVIREERLRAPGLEASDVLRTQPGVAVLETGGYGSPSTASIRGATAAETPVYLAGVRLNDDVGGTADLSLVPLWMVHRVEIYRSNAPLAGDQMGIGGAIFFEPRRPKGTEAAGGAMAGSFGARALWVRAGMTDGAAIGLVGVRLDGARNDYSFLNEGGTLLERGHDRIVELTNADTKTVDAWASASVGLGARGRVDLVANDVEREQGLPSVRLFSSLRARVARSRRLVALTTRVKSTDDTFEITTSTAAVIAHAGYDDPLAEAGLGTSKVDIDATRVEQVALVRWSPSEHLSVTPVARASIERLAIDPLLQTPAHVERVFSRAALQGEWSLSHEVTLRALGSAECNGTSPNGLPPWSLPGDPRGPTGGNKACNQFEPILRIGAQIGASPLALLATIGRYARVPTLTELYGLSGAVLGNTALEPEIGLSAEIGVRAGASNKGVLRGASVDLFGFVRSASHLITYQRASIVSVRPFNIGSGRIAGLELLASYRPAPFALVELAATLLDPRNTAPNRPVNQILPYQPRLVLAPRVELGSTIDAHPIDSGKISFSYFFESSRYADLAGLEVIPTQGSLDAEGELGVLDGHLTLRGRFANLLDQTRKDLIGYPLPGRTAYAALEARW